MMETILRDGLAQLELSADVISSLLRYAALLEEKNKVMNLTAITDPDEVARLHFLDSAALLKVLDFRGKTVVDVGTGAGFPGLPIRILEPSARVTLLDSLGKRITFLQEVCDDLGLSDVTCVHALQCSAKVDWAKKAISVAPTWVGYVLQFLSTCVPTLVIEALILLLYGYKWKTSWKPFLTVNLVTQGALALYYSVTIVRHGMSFWFLFLFVPAEVVVAVAEALLYRRFLTGQSKTRAVVYGLTANAASAVIGFFLAEPVWQFVVSIS